MHIGIVGAGFVGVCTALELSLRGHRVEVFERRSGIAAESSFAGAGILCPTVLPSLTRHPRWQQRAPWNPQARHQARARKQPDWLARQQVLVRLSELGERWLERLESEHHLEFEQRRGWLILHSDERSLKLGPADAAHLVSLGLPHQVLGREALSQAEPALDTGRPAAGGLWLPQVRVVNTRQLAQLLRQLAQQAGALFHLNTEVDEIDPRHPTRLSHGAMGSNPRQETRFDAVALCTGTTSMQWLKTQGLRLPLRAAPGCSVTAPLNLPEAMPDPGPQGAVTDAQTGLVLSRLGTRVRITDPWAELDAKGRPSSRTQSRMYGALERWFPEAGHGNPAQAWQGTRATLPDDAPVVGPSPWPGLWLNLGHGDQGSALAGGCAHLLADGLEGRPAQDGQDLLSCTRW
ncbi:NAD(P)/FAD-dependent oxidoreductase [Ideonella oryzae]|uniref:FAD-dependent oxidoreductase n=1 Tax=Ideonella oryzae TaxID=2937441 RepID=A0ABT1BK68_9BURK|nr:FAD-dependent oxidoreductase [Ideonella oryzae]MCO5976498.1 FAD-dependent oxidoreductase [Ideonella oryzae]